MFQFLPFSKKKEPEEASVDEDFYAHREEIATARKGRKSSKTKKSDQEELLLNEKKRARRRLVGAVTLMLGLVIALPVVFDSEPKSALDDIDIRIPSKEKVSLSRPKQVMSAVTQRELPPKDEAPKDEPYKDEPYKDEPYKDEPYKDEPPKQEESTAKANAQPAQTGGELVVQVAALTNQKMVDELRAKLKRSGIKSYTEKASDAKDAPIRVRIGPFAKNSDAEATCAKLMMLELKCTILTN